MLTLHQCLLWLLSQDLSVLAYPTRLRFCLFLLLFGVHAHTISLIRLYLLLLLLLLLLFRDAIKLRYDWEIADLPAMCTCGDLFTVDHAMVCRHGGLIIQRHNEIRDLEAEMLRMVCTDVEIEPVLQEITGEELNRGANRAPDARLDIHARGFWDRQQSAFF